MATGGQKRTRSERVAALELPPGRFTRALMQLKRADVLLRLALCLIAAGIVWTITASWNPPFRERVGHIPTRDVVAQVSFKEFDPAATEDARERAASQVRYVYSQDPDPLVQLRAALQRRMVEVTSATSLAVLGQDVWREFQPPPVEGTDPPTQEQQDAAFERMHAALTGETALADFEAAVANALATFERHGLLDKLPQELDKGNQKEIFVHLKTEPSERQLVQVTDVLIGDGSQLEKNLARQISSPELAARTFTWLKPRLPQTLTLDEAATEQARQEAALAVPPQFKTYSEGQVLAKRGHPLTEQQIAVLGLEYQEMLAQRTMPDKLYRSLAILGLITALYALCGSYIYFRERRFLNHFSPFLTLLMCVVLAVGLARWLSNESWRMEMIPLLLFGMTMAIAYSQELALLLSASLALLMVVTLGLGPMFGQFLVLGGVVSAAILLLSRVRSRSKLIKVGMCAAVAAFLLTLGAGVLENQPIGRRLLTTAGINALWALMTGFLMTGMLPFIERMFGVLTEISLLELGDVAHPLLQELVRRAPGTYNHSINVASIAEAAAESIGAKGLLVRVGSYFHDIGKMLKPGYFIENMGQETNRHDSLVPAMSTLIIIAHIKDGADLARQHHLPQPIIDFIEQHHGTTLVEYFFRRANEQRENDPEAGEVDERSYRYPGPKPQTKEAAVLMMADAVESASRVLVEPTPARIEGLVNEIAMKRLLDGQFDESGLNLLELRAVQESLIKSMTAVYHGRVKYPSQRTA